MSRPKLYDESLRQALLKAASAAIAAHGKELLSLRRVVAEAQTTTAAVYALFGSREDLIAAVVEEGFYRFARRLADVPRTEDPKADLLALGIAYREYALAEPHYYRAMFNDSQRDGDQDVLGKETFDVLVSAVRRAFGTTIDDARLEAIRLWGLVHGLVSLEMNGLLAGAPEERARVYVQALRVSA